MSGHINRKRPDGVLRWGGRVSPRNTLSAIPSPFQLLSPHGAGQPRAAKPSSTWEARAASLRLVPTLTPRHTGECGLGEAERLNAGPGEAQRGPGRAICTSPASVYKPHF